MNAFFALFGKVVLVALVIAILVGGGVYIGRQLNTQPTAPEISQPATTSQPAATSPATVTPTPPDDSKLIAQALYKKHNWPEGSMTIKVSTNDSKYASGGVTGSGGGGYFFAAKVGGVWEIVADGNGVILCSSLTAYADYPATLIPECYDQAAGKTVKR